MVHFGPISKVLTNLEYSKGRTLRLKTRFENSICFLFYLSTYLLLYVPCMQNFKKMHACEVAGDTKLG